MNPTVGLGSEERQASLPADVERRAFLLHAARALRDVAAVAELRSGERLLEPTGIRLRSLVPGGEGLALAALAEPRRRTEAARVIARQLESLCTVSVPEFAPAPAGGAAAWRSRLAPGERGKLALPARRRARDFRFSFPLPPCEPPPTLADHLARWLEVVVEVAEVLTPAGPVDPDALRFRDRLVRLRRPDPARGADLGPRAERDLRGRQPLHGVASVEPAIVALARHWSLLAAALELGGGGDPLRLDGFQLRDAADWVVPSACDPSEVYEHLARVCNVSCKFCYLFGNPGGIAIARGAKLLSREELDTRLAYFDPPRRRALFRSQWEINEFLVDPKLPDVLGELRRRSDAPFFFITNGSPLNEETVKLLSRVRPVHLVISINSLDAELRSAVMGETRNQTRTALDCLHLLREHDLPFGVSLVVYPDFSFEELGRTIERLAPAEPAFVRINLPGFTRDHPQQLDLDTGDFWTRASEHIRRWRGATELPLLTIPSAFEENRHADPNAARVLGAIPDSPASRAGLRFGDTISRVGMFDIHTRAQALATLQLMRGRFPLRVAREGVAREVELDAARPARRLHDGHRFGKYFFPHGVVCAPSLSATAAAEVRERVLARNARRVWLFTSAIMRPAGEALLRHHAADVAERIELVVVPNRFLGGNICVLDMATVGDMAAELEQQLVRRGSPDLVLVPGTGLSAQGRDLAGAHWSELERRFGIPVELVASPARFAF